jgi:membrane protease YdiL (CAAX protease family)
MYRDAVSAPPTETRAVPRRSSFQTLLASHPLVAYFMLAFVGSWIVELPLAFAKNGLGLLPIAAPVLPSPWSYLPGALASVTGPALAGIVMTTVMSGKAGVQRLLRRCVLWRVGLQWYFIVLVGMPLSVLVCASVLLQGAPLIALVHRWPLIFTAYLPFVLIISVVSIAWEEIGWSGFALPRLQQRYHAVWGSVLLGALWGLWHLPLLFIPGQGTGPQVGLVTLLVASVLELGLLTALFRIIMTWVFNNTRGSVLIAVLVHAVSDAANAASVFVGQLLPRSAFAGYFLGYCLAIAVGATLLLIVTKGRLAYVPQRSPELAATPVR